MNSGNVGLARLVSALALSCLDYCNAVLVGLPVAPLQRVLYAVARHMLDLKPHDHVTPCPSGVALASCRATNRVQTLSPRAQGPNWCQTTSPTCSRWSPTLHHALHCVPPAMATSSNQEPSGKLVSMQSLSLHLVHGITYRQN